MLSAIVDSQLGIWIFDCWTIMASMRQAMGIQTTYMLESIDVHFIQAGHALFSGWKKTEGRIR